MKIQLIIITYYTVIIIKYKLEVFYLYIFYLLFLILITAVYNFEIYRKNNFISC